MHPRLALVTGLVLAALAAPAGRADDAPARVPPADPAPGFEAPPPSSRFT
jgi:hypothetical protein